MFLMNYLCLLCLLTSPFHIRSEELSVSDAKKEDDALISARSYGGGGYGIGGYGSGGYYGGGGGHYSQYEQPHYYPSYLPSKKLYVDLGLPLVVGGLGLGLGVGALKGLILGAILGKKKHQLIHSGYGYDNYGGHGGYGGYGGLGNIGFHVGKHIGY